MNRPVVASTSLNLSSFIEILGLKNLIKDIYFGKNIKIKEKELLLQTMKVLKDITLKMCWYIKTRQILYPIINK